MAELSPVMRFLHDEHWTDGTLIGLKDDLLAGLTIAVTQVPQAIAFSVVGKMNPMFGLYSTLYLTMIMSIFGARSGAIYGAAGALAVEFPHVVEKVGTEGVLAATIGCGILSAIPGVFRVTDYVRMLPNTVMIGFVDGLAILIFRGTLVNFQDANDKWITGMLAFYTCLIMFVTFAVMWLMPLATRVIPATIVAVIIGTSIEYIFSLGTVTVGDKYKASGTLRAPDIPRMSSEAWRNNVGLLIGESFVYMIIGAVESLMTQIMLDKANNNKSSMDREMFVFGIANIVNGFLGGMAGCALVGPTILNMMSGGGKRRLSGVVNGLITLICIFAASQAIEIIPLGALSAVTFTICIRTFDWKTFYHVLHLPPSDSFIILVVTVVTYFTDLAIGVAAGVGVALITSAFRLRDNVLITVNPQLHTVELPSDPTHDGDAAVMDTRISKPLRIRVVHLSGVLFFASAPDFLLRGEDLAGEICANDAATDVVFDFEHCIVQDFGGIEALDSVAEVFATKHNIRAHFVNIERNEPIFRRGAPYFAHFVPTSEELPGTVACSVVDPATTEAEIAKSLRFPSYTVATTPKVKSIVGVTYARVEELGINVPVVAHHELAPLPDDAESEMQGVCTAEDPAQAEPHEADEPHKVEADVQAAEPTEERLAETPAPKPCVLRAAVAARTAVFDEAAMKHTTPEERAAALALFAQQFSSTVSVENSAAETEPLMAGTADAKPSD